MSAEGTGGICKTVLAQLSILIDFERMGGEELRVIQRAQPEESPHGNFRAGFVICRSFRAYPDGYPYTGFRSAPPCAVTYRGFAPFISACCLLLNEYCILLTTPFSSFRAIANLIGGTPCRLALRFLSGDSSLHYVPL